MVIEGRPRARARASIDPNHIRFRSRARLRLYALRAKSRARGTGSMRKVEPGASRALKIKTISIQIGSARVARAPSHFTMFSRYRTRNLLIISSNLQDNRRWCVLHATAAYVVPWWMGRAWLNAPSPRQGCASRASRARLSWDRVGRGNARG